MQYLLKMLLILSFILEGSLLSNTGAMNTQIISLVNTSHLDNLYRNINYDNREMGIVLIYADYPDYHTVDAKGEGIACVDDAARHWFFISDIIM